MHPEIGRQVAQARRTLASPARLALTEIRLGLHHVLTARRAPLEDALFLAVVFEKRGAAG
jgi:hypothetical protein